MATSTHQSHNDSAQTREHLELENTNRWSTRELVTMALMCALGTVFSFVQIPLIPAAPFLTYDPSLVPAMVSGLAFGTGPGLVVGILTACLHGLVTGEWVGSLMNVVATVCYVAPAVLVYARAHSNAGAIGGLALGVVLATAGSIVANLTIGVAFWYGSADVIMPLVLPAVLPFNLVKTILNSVLALVAFKSLAALIDPEKGSGRA